jgi:hypothetical protein
MVNRLQPFLLAVCVLAPAVPAAQAEETAELKKKINRAVDRGVAYLKKLQLANGCFVDRTNDGGAPINEWQADGSTALAGLTLLECGVPAKDEVVKKAADYVRERSVKFTGTYVISLAIMFLDRLGDPSDVPLIESLTVRLLAGQCPKGGWSYTCPAISQAEVRRLTKYLKERSELVSKGKLPKTAPNKKRTERDLPQEILEQLVLINRRGIQGPARALEDGDNSNTQFATLALWVARRHGLPVHGALRRLDERFRAFQFPNGAWAYQASFQAANLPCAAMTCAGLLGLATGHGAVNEKIKERNPKAKRLRDPNKDPAIKKGLIALAAAIGEPLGDGKGSALEMKDRAARAYYYLWSLERVAMVYGLDKIGKKDWYRWGAEIILANQSLDGSWKGNYTEGGVDTSFALLFLRRSNLAPDLTAYLKGSIRNAGEVVSLKSGGRGGQKLVLGKDIQPDLDLTGKGKRNQKDALPPAREKTDVLPQAKEDQDRQITKLSTEFVRASGDEQETVLKKLRDSKGVVYTEALAGSIPLLKGAMKGKARAALAQRMTRMRAVTLKEKFQDDNLEVRRAAALACASKKLKALIPDVIELLGDPELPVALAARQALKDLTGKDFGPEDDATRAERKAAIAEWKAWWKKRPKE